MRMLKFKCTLLSDIILNQRSATEGAQNTLDFIPGSNFLGITASELYHKIPAGSALELFHSGLVRFGDAHPLLQGHRSLRVPASMYYPKLGSKTTACYIHHAIPIIENQDEAFHSLQLKQCRSEFYIFSDVIGTEVNVGKTFVLKSAYDRNSRRSKDEALYCYESINEGLVYGFEVECADEISDDKVEMIKRALTGIKRVGRSKTAQFGLVEIAWMGADGYAESQSAADKERVTVYADGRLIFLDEQTGLPTYQPTMEQLGLIGGRILWEESQIRTFQYAPWNVKRHAFDVDRCGIEKGSVFVVADATSPACSQYVGTYNNEGFGKVIYNPDFLEAEVNSGKALYALRKQPEQRFFIEKESLTGDPLLCYLDRRKKSVTIHREVYAIVNSFVEKECKKLGANSSNETFASQWGSIRKIAMRYRTKDSLIAEINKYLSHGVAEERWAERGRKQTLLDFIRENLTEENAQLVIVNLAAEMAKKCSKNGKG